MTDDCRFHRICLIAVVTAFSNAVFAMADGHRVTVTAGKTVVRNAPVSAPLPTDLVGKAVALVNEKGAAVPVQVDAASAKPSIVWIVESLPAGQSTGYELRTAAADSTEQQHVQLTTTKEGLDVRIDGELFTTYQTNAGPKPYCWPIIGPTGKPVTRDYPMKKGTPGENYDHHHHRSFWFTHGKVNGVNFWAEEKNAGVTVHREFGRIVSGPVFGEFTSRVDWLDATMKTKICQDARRLRFYRAPGARLFDFEIAVEAADGPVVFGDDKEGTFGFRVAGTMDVDQKGGKPGGTLVNAEGIKNKDAWGKRFAWCDYFGPVDGEVVGIAMFDRPGNLRHPTYWHARTYGLYCANPFGSSVFTGDKSNDGSHTIEAGKELRLSYRLYIHRGDTAAAGVADQYAAFATPPAVKVE